MDEIRLNHHFQVDKMFIDVKPIVNMVDKAKKFCRDLQIGRLKTNYI